MARFARRSLSQRLHGNRGLARRYVADTQCLVCKKSFVTPDRAVQHGNNARCKHAMLNGKCVENAPEEQTLWNTRWRLFAATHYGQVSPFQLAPWLMDRHEFVFFSSVAVLPCWVAASPVSPTCAFVFRCDSDEFGCTFSARQTSSKSASKTQTQADLERTLCTWTHWHF